MIELYLSSNNEICYSTKIQIFHQLNTPKYVGFTWRQESTVIQVAIGKKMYVSFASVAAA